MSGVSPTPLDGLRVVEISDRIAGAYCGKLLVDAGADVVKVEPVGGDPLRRFTATGAVPPAGTDAPLFSYLNSGKRSVTATSGSLGNLLNRADVVIVAAIEREFDPQPLLDESPQCVVVTVSDFGLTGPWSRPPGDRIHAAGLVGIDRFPR